MSRLIKIKIVRQPLMEIKPELLKSLSNKISDPEMDDKSKEILANFLWNIYEFLRDYEIVTLKRLE